MYVPTINKNLCFKKSLKIVSGFQTDLAKSNVSVLSYNAVSDNTFNQALIPSAIAVHSVKHNRMKVIYSAFIF